MVQRHFHQLDFGGIQGRKLADQVQAATYSMLGKDGSIPSTGTGLALLHYVIGGTAQFLGPIHVA
ncbi:MAG TPA: hypothetical protein VK914_01500 [bacterium]|nr:hypothetical protein [bacterium]